MAMFNSYPPRTWNLPCDLQNPNRNPNCCRNLQNITICEGGLFFGTICTQPMGFFPCQVYGILAKLISLDPTLDLKSDSAGVRENWRIVGLKKHGEILLGGCWPTPLKNDGVSSSVGMMTFPIWWERHKIPWFQTTNPNNVIIPWINLLLKIWMAAVEMQSFGSKKITLDDCWIMLNPFTSLLDHCYLPFIPDLLQISFTQVSPFPKGGSSFSQHFSHGSTLQPPDHQGFHLHRFTAEVQQRHAQQFLTVPQCQQQQHRWRCGFLVAEYHLIVTWGYHWWLGNIMKKCG